MYQLAEVPRLLPKRVYRNWWPCPLECHSHTCRVELAADELHTNAKVSDATWAALSARYTTQQLMDTVFAVGQYTLVSMALNSFGVQLDKGVKGF